MITQKEVKAARRKVDARTYRWFIGDRTYQADKGHYLGELEYFLKGPGIISELKRFGMRLGSLERCEYIIAKTINELEGKQ